MAAAHTKQLEDKVARYERIISQCHRCKAALALEEVEDVTPPSAPPHSTGSSLQTAPKGSSTNSGLSSKNPKPTSRQYRSTRSSKQDTSTSRPIPSPSSTDVVDSMSSIPPSANPVGKTATGPSQDTVRQSSGLSKETTVDAVAPLPVRPSTEPAFTVHSLDLRLTSLKPSTSGIGTVSAGTSGPDAIEPGLSRSDSNAQLPRDDPHKQGGWLVSADKMLEEVPLGWVWHAKMLQLDKSMLAAVAIDSSPVPDDTIGSLDDTQNKDHLLTLVRGFAHRHSEKRVNFQHFLLLCLCKVLSAQKTPKSSIVEALQICISDTSDRNIDRYLKGAKWANVMLDRLFFTGWRYRAVDLMIIWDRSIAMYARIATATSYPTNDYFVSHLSQAEFCKNVKEIPNRVHSTIPWIVKNELGDGVSYETICKALGYSKDYILETKHLHSSTHSSAIADSSSSEGEDSASETLSFHTARHSANGAFTPLRPGPAATLPSGDLDVAAYLRAWSQSGRELLPKDNHQEPGRRDPATDQITDLQRTERGVPDRSVKPLRLSDVVPPRMPPSVDPNTGELLVSSSLGASAPGTGSTKRPLPDSPTSPLQPDNTARRHHHEGEMSSRGEMGSSSRSRKKDSHKQRSRA